MDFFTHLIIAVIISIFTLNSMPISLVLYACLMAILADLDIFLEPLRKVFKSNLLAHKGISHSIFYSILVSALTGVIFSFITNESFLLAWLIGFLFYDLHIFLDFLTASKIPIFYPITKKRFRFFIDRAINFPLALISGGIIFFYIILFFSWRELVFSDLYYYIIGFYLSYFTFRIFVKIIIKIKYPKSYKYIPGVFPFSYLLYNKSEINHSIYFKLISKNIFKNENHIIFETSISETSLNMQLYLKTINLVKKFPFGEKWDVKLPLFEEFKDKIILTLFFAESYVKGRCYSIKIIFNSTTKEALALSQGFNTKILET